MPVDQSGWPDLNRSPLTPSQRSGVPDSPDTYRKMPPDLGVRLAGSPSACHLGSPPESAPLRPSRCSDAPTEGNV
jgi:hypothetical protein